MRISILGEAINNLSKKFKKEHKEIPWQDIADMRNKLIHEYFGIDVEVVWETTQEDVPELKKKILELMKALDIDRSAHRLV